MYHIEFYSQDNLIASFGYEIKEDAINHFNLVCDQQFSFADYIIIKNDSGVVLFDWSKKDV